MTFKIRKDSPNIIAILITIIQPLLKKKKAAKVT